MYCHCSFIRANIVVYNLAYEVSKNKKLVITIALEVP